MGRLGMKFRVLTLDRMAEAGLEAFPADLYEVGPEIDAPHAILLRSRDLHSFEFPDSVLAVGRAGIGVDNIPVAALSGRGIPVFNAPGANANAVKELVIAGLFLASRKIAPALEFVRGLEGDAVEVSKAVEAGKRRFVGFELPGRTLGVVGLGAVGVEVANAALALGMRVIGFDPGISVSRAWQLSSGVQQAGSLDALFIDADMVTLHVPLTEDTRAIVDERRFGLMRPGAVLLNFAREPLVDETALLASLESGRLFAYVTDFPTPGIKDHPAVTALPHLGASTGEAESNSVKVVAQTIRGYLENGTIRHSVNYPEAVLHRGGGYRLAIVNANVPGIVGRVSTALAAEGLNIADLLNVSQGDLAYTLIDVETPIPEKTFTAIQGIEGVIAARVV